MEFSSYYKNKDVVKTYEEKRSKGLKSDITRKLERLAVGILLDGTGSKIIEAGVGTGFITEILRMHGKVSGFDISPAMISETKAKFPDMDIKESSIFNFKAKERYDSAVSIRVISHFKPDEALKAVKNLKAMTKKEGSIIFNLENRSLIRRFLRKLSHWGSTETYQYSAADLDWLAENAGLKIKEKVYIDHSFLLPFHIINKLAFNSLDNFIINLETKLFDIRFASANTFVKLEN